MPDESSKKTHSEPAPPTDDIDQDWGTTPAPPGASKATTVKAALGSTSARADREEDDEDDDEEDVEDEEDDEDDEDDDDDDEDEAHSSREVEKERPGSGSDDWLPNWAPWAVLGGLCVIALVGGLGGLSRSSTSQTAIAAAEPEPPPPEPAAPALRADANEKVSASHLLVAYQGAMRASPQVTRSKAEAKTRAEQALAKAKKGTPFEALVSEYSDEPGAAARKGALGTFTRDRMVKPFADAAFALEPGALSGVVETDFGYHVILRTQ